MHHFILATKDTWITSGSSHIDDTQFRDQNFGQDEILELKKFFYNNKLDHQTRVLVQFDLTELSNPKIHLNYYAQVNAIDHNGYIKEDLFYMASYSAGLRVLDISRVQNKRINEIGFFESINETGNTLKEN